MEFTNTIRADGTIKPPEKDYSYEDPIKLDIYICFN
ncbi:Uncharacterised protein [Yersinia similis]|nr:Uncharacterised protein [Yersinia similis]CNF44491.1 Uncharacterised protein [Yersinia similis]